jgi:NAD(P)-dependent dehydrogenase (short-subunit alcohol dehydrogenase family)
MNVAILDLTEAHPESVAAGIDKSGKRVLGYVADVRDRPVLKNVYERIAGDLGDLDTVVTAAGVYRSDRFEVTSSDEWRFVVDVNLTGTFNALVEAVPYQRTKGSGANVLISSTGAYVGWPGHHAYCASKTALLGLMRTMSSELARDGIRTNCVCPGSTNTPMMDAVDADVSAAEGHDPGWFRKSLLNTIPLGRLAEPWDIAELVAFLVSDSTVHMTGQAIRIDGGLVPS